MILGASIVFHVVGVTVRSEEHAIPAEDWSFFSQLEDTRSLETSYLM